MVGMEDEDIQASLALIRVAEAAIQGCESPSQLAGVANEAWRSADRHGLNRSIEAGGALLAAKTRVGHGSWKKWIKLEWEHSQRNAQICMQIAEHWSRLETEAQRAAFLSFGSVRSALAAITSPKQPTRRRMLAPAQPDPRVDEMNAIVHAEVEAPPLPPARVEASCSTASSPLNPERSWVTRTELVDSCLLAEMEAKRRACRVISMATIPPVVKKVLTSCHGKQLFVCLGQVPETQGEGSLVAFKLVPRAEWQGETFTPSEFSRRRANAPTGCRGLTALGLVVRPSGSKREHVLAEAVEFAVAEHIVLRELERQDEWLRNMIARVPTAGRRHLAAVERHLSEAVKAAKTAHERWKRKHEPKPLSYPDSWK